MEQAFFQKKIFKNIKIQWFGWILSSRELIQNQLRADDLEEVYFTRNVLEMSWSDDLEETCFQEERY